jgi:hypothetical protein
VPDDESRAVQRVHLRQRTEELRREHAAIHAKAFDKEEHAAHKRRLAAHLDDLRRHRRR